MTSKVPGDEGKATAGPWQKEVYHGDDILSVYGADGYEVAECHYMPSRLGGDGPEDFERAGPELHANARLIAAAPDLLAALESIDKIANDMGGKTPAQRCALIAELARAAIAAAKGA